MGKSSLSRASHKASILPFLGTKKRLLQLNERVGSMYQVANSNLQTLSTKTSNFLVDLRNTRATGFRSRCTPATSETMLVQEVIQKPNDTKLVQFEILTKPSYK